MYVHVYVHVYVHACTYTCTYTCTYMYRMLYSVIISTVIIFQLNVLISNDHFTTSHRKGGPPNDAYPSSPLYIGKANKS